MLQLGLYFPSNIKHSDGYLNIVALVQISMETTDVPLPKF